MPETPTTEGSIVAYLRLNKSDWDAQLDEAEAKAKELGQLDPTIRVRAETADALAQLEAVKEAEDRAGGTTTTTSRVNTVTSGSGAAEAAAKVDSVAAATKRLEQAQTQLSAAERVSANAATSLELAQMRLDAVQTKRGRTDMQVANAEAQLSRAVLAVEAADMRHDTATRKLTEAKAGLTAAEHAAAAATRDGVTATDDISRATAKAAESNRGNASQMALIVAAVAALIPLAAPLTGFALGGAGALTEMGLAGVLAFKGIGAEMAADTDLGGQYQDNLAKVQDDLHGLEATAAAGIITPFNKALDYLQPQMPRINQDMGAMATWLGQIAGTSVEAVIGGFETMEPLLVSGEKLLQGWAYNLRTFSTSPEFREFISYSVTELPQVNDMLINLGGVVLHLVDAFTPVGNVVIPVLSAVAWGLNQIPTPVLTGLAVGGAAVGTAFLAWNYAIEPLLTKMGALTFESTGAAGAQAAVAAAADTAAAAETGAAVATTGWAAALDFASGPVGLMIGLLAAIFAGTAAATSATQANTAAQVDFTAAIQADNGAIRDHVAVQAAKTLTDKGAYDAAKQLGISTDLVTKATLGQGNAYQSLTGQLDQIIAKNTLTAGAHQGNAKALTSEGRAAEGLLGTLKSLHGTLSNQIKTNEMFAGAAVKAGDASQALAEDQNLIDDASKSADSATLGYINALDKYAKSAGTAADQGTFLGDTLVAMQGDWLSYDGALANAAYANYTLTQTFQDQGKEMAQGVKFIRDYEKGAIDLNTGMIDVSKSGAPALLQQLTAMQSAASKAAAATYQHEVATQGAGQAAADAAKIFKGDTYDALVKDADQLGLTADQAKKLADRYFGLPSDVITQLQTEGQATVVQTLDGIGQQLAEISGHPWTSTLDANGVPLSHEAYMAQLRLSDVTQFAKDNPAVIAADAKAANTTVDDFVQRLASIPADKTVTLTVQAQMTANAQAVANQFAAGNVYTTGKASGGTIYKAAGGMVEAAYLAAGGSPFQPRGTDTIPAMLTQGEFVVKQSSASFNPGFLKAYNDNPAGAIAAVSSPTVVSLKGATIVMNVDGREMTAIIQDQIVSANRTQAAGLRAGKQRGAF